MAAAAGAVGIETRIARDGNHVKHDIDGELFVSATLTATATGRPANKRQAVAGEPARAAAAAD